MLSKDAANLAQCAGIYQVLSPERRASWLRRLSQADALAIETRAEKPVAFNDAAWWWKQDRKDLLAAKPLVDAAVGRTPGDQMLAAIQARRSRSTFGVSRMLKKTAAVLALCLLGLPAIASAQITVDAGKPFRVILTHDGLNVTDYQITIDPPGTTAPNIVLTRVLATRDTATGEVAFDVNAQTVAGSYTVVGCARNVDPANVAATSTTCAASVAFSVVVPTMPKPTVPTVRITGTLTANGQTIPFSADIATILLTVKDAPK